ncbi:hypothetical protein DM02DRAFT_268139 [Periconia macrospinosa]|uniref:Uncharacterized protein n=1 Tax=Periconia macrospinosa TaxID=97972 RepID=A0A2V1DXQ6_9PLEO|nr:hypothetical protein DM02DRAFT_268139 [Periconia macrospinosa]
MESLIRRLQLKTDPPLPLQPTTKAIAVAVGVAVTRAIPRLQTVQPRRILAFSALRSPRRRRVRRRKIEFDFARITYVFFFFSSMGRLLAYHVHGRVYGISFFAGDSGCGTFVWRD